MDTPQEVQMTTTADSLAMQQLNEGAAEQQAGIDIAELLKQKNILDNQAAVRAQQAGEAAGRSAASTAIGLKAAQDATQEAIKLLSADIFDPQSLKAKSMKEFVQRKQEADAQLEDIKAKSSVGFFDNPLEYIVNQMSLPQAVQQYNMTAIQANGALNTVQQLDSTLTAEAQTQKATAVTLTNQSVADAATLAANEFQKQADEYKIKALGANVDAIKAIRDGNKAVVDAQMKVWQMSMTEEGHRLQREAADRARQLFALQLAEFGDKQATKDMWKNTVKAGMGVYHLPLPDDGSLDNIYKAYQIAGPEAKAKLQSILDAGIRKLTVGDNNVGMTPGEAWYNLVKTNGNWKDSPSLPAIKQLNELAESLIKSGAVNPKNKSQMIAAINTNYEGALSPDGKSKMQGLIGSWNANPSTSPLYRDPGFLTVADSSFVKNTEFYNKVLSASVLAKTQSMTPDAVISAGIKAIEDGTIKLEDAASGISKYYQTVGMINATSNSLIGIPPQKGYNYNVANGGAIFSKKYDLANENQVMSALLTIISKRNYITGGLGIPGFETFNQLGTAP